MPARRERVRVAGRELTLTNLDKVLYPETGTTKADVLAYYAGVAHVLVPAAAGRPATRKRWVNGVGTAEEPGQMFFQKNLDESTPGWVPRAAITHKDRTIHYPLVNDPATLAWFGQIGSLEVHVPQWRVDSHGNALPPDRLVLDLDPGPGAGLPECVEVALLARAILQDVGLDPLPVTSGSKGIHLYARLDGSQSSDQISAFAHELARALEADHPDLAVSDMKKTLRQGKVLVDWSQNSAAKTTVVPYSLRGRPTPTVAAPRTWEELESGSLEHLDYKEVLQRVQAGEDPFAPISGARVGNDSGSAGGSDGADNPRLEKYRSMRDPSRTPEPFTGTPDEQVGLNRTFVIQEHHATRLHYDFRLEHDGVLVSWAIPKGVPESPDKNHLAVQTEDHPLDYASFEGTIPKGEYGAGEVTIWDHGTYETHKWINGKEVIVTLTGADDGGLGGTRKVALIKTGRSDGKDQWLIHLMEKESHRYPKRRPEDDPEDLTGVGIAPGKQEERQQEEDTDTAQEEPEEEEQQHEQEPPSATDFRPMLASSGTTADLNGSDWQFELKWDGVRTIVIGGGGTIRLYSRNGIDVSATYPEFTDPVLWPDRTFVADGEIIAVGPSGKPDFGLLQGRMKLTRPGDVRKAQRGIPVRLMLFDLLYDGGADLRAMDLLKRRARLESFYGKADTALSKASVELSPVLKEDLEDLLESAGELGLEGIMAKRADARYVSGQRTRTWVKLKLEQTQEVVVGGWRTGKGGRSGTVGSLLLGIPEDGGLRYVGRVGSGFSGRELAEIKEKMDRLARKTSPFLDVPATDASDAHWIKPELVGEVTFGEWTESGRLRHPVWRGWRVDKTPEDVVPG